jgi:orotate phosphoribosyltransferase
MTGSAAVADGILRDAGAMLSDDHYVYISGQHGSGWIDKDAVYPHTQATATLGRLIAEAVGDRRIDVVCGPATGGLILAQWTAHHLGALAVVGEHGDDHDGLTHPQARRPFVLRRGYERLVPGRQVLVVDDVVNTGFSIRGSIEAVRAHGGEVSAAAAVVNRGALEPAAIGVDELRCVTDIRLDSWPAADCPLCARGVPVNTEYAHGADYVAAGGRGAGGI